MSIATALGKAVGGILLSLGIVLIILSYPAANITEKSTLQPMFTNLVFSQIQLSDTQLETAKNAMFIKCSMTGVNNITFPLQGMNITILCEDIETLTVQQLKEQVATNFFEQFYYKDYGCDFLTCLQKLKGMDLALFFASAKAHEFFVLMFYLSIAITIIGIVLIVVSIRKLFSSLKAIGICLISAGIPYFVLLGVFSYLNIPQQILQSQSIIFQTLNGIMTSFLIVFIIGIILTVIGIVGRYYHEKDIITERRSREDKSKKK